MVSDKKLSRPVYLDNHATTQTDPRVVEAMLPYFNKSFGNPHSGSHYYGWEAADAVELARGQVADSIGASPEEIYFTSGATEANNIALKGATRFYREKKNHIVTCVTEHPCILDSAHDLASEGTRVTFLEVGSDGLIDLDNLKDAITDDTLLVSVMTVQNEIGTVQPIAEIGELCHQHEVLLHTDAAQALGKMSLDVKAMNVDLMSITGHKVYGPMGCGALYLTKKPRVKIKPLFSGGGQEKSIRPGTLPAPLCVGFGKTCELAAIEVEGEAKRLRQMRDELLTTLNNNLFGVHVNGGMKQRIPGNLNISVEGVDAESLMAALPDLAVSSGSACTSASAKASYVLDAIGLTTDLAESSLRIGLGRFTLQEEVNYAANRLIEEIRNIRKNRQVLSVNAAE
ncbi:MAG TPA: aminotransferase class V-fold PLP-dependent enzyme [Rhodospirillales bacterium]|nr:aminotransferase class V-fold PLP-dependent enzyme [Rhodospirillales bacterium]